MKKLLSVMVLLMAVASVSMAAVRVGTLENLPHVIGPNRPVQTLDDQCTANFLGFTWGTYAGSEIWPGGNGVYYMTGYAIHSSCQPNDTLVSYCIDLDHELRRGNYCANMDAVTVRPAYPEQYPAMAYLLAWYPATSALQDRIAQLSLWKMANDQRSSSLTSGAPWYSINSTRGFPDPNDPATYPYVNTVYNTEPSVNDAANARVRLALGTTDGIQKNVVLCDDQFEITVGRRHFEEETVWIPVTVQLVRGTSAIAVGNTAVSGVKVQFTASAGQINTTEAFTDASGQIHLTITQPIGNPVDVNFHVSSQGGWMRTITPCEGYINQQLLTINRCELSVDRTIPGDQWLAAELASFDATAHNNSIELSWRSLSENGAARYEIERSEAGRDFAAMASIPAVNAAAGHAYHYADASVERGVNYQYRLVDVDVNGARMVHRDMTRAASLPAITVQPSYELAGNYPNPFNPETTIRFALAEEGNVTLKVYDITGHEVATLSDGKLAAGEHSVSFHAANLPSGIYFYKLTAGTFTQTRKMILAK